MWGVKGRENTGGKKYTKGRGTRKGENEISIRGCLPRGRRGNIGKEKGEALREPGDGLVKERHQEFLSGGMAKGMDIIQKKEKLFTLKEELGCGGES